MTARSASFAGAMPAGAPGAAGRAASRAGIGVLGATGYAGAELVRLLSGHPGARLAAVGSRQNAGRTMSRVFPSMPTVDLLLDDDPDRPETWLDRGVEVVFSALPHGAFAARARAWLGAGLRIIDLSADFRLRGAGEFHSRHGVEHPHPRLLERAVYGLTEWCGPEIDTALLVANPGCYATAVLLGLLPAIAAGWASAEPILVNAVSGVSGAGRAPSLTTHFAECDGSVAPYKVGEEHPHLGEILQAIGRVPGEAPGPVIFNPHLAPMSRGILASMALPLRRPVDPGQAREMYLSRYAGSVFVRVLDEAMLPETRHVRGSNRCDLAVRTAAGGRVLLIFAAIDNLIKGAAGQAVQNFNRMMGWPEETGLPLAAWSCA